MIDVPIAVRDALKDGGYKKNYRFVVGDVVKTYVYEDVATIAPNTLYTITEAGTMRFHSVINVRDFQITFEKEEDVYVDPVERMTYDVAGGYYYTYNITSEMIGGTLFQDSDYSLILQKPTDTKEEVFVENYTINNDRLVKESVKIDERMCSDDTLKFGLCEGTSIEFQAFDINNMTGKRIQALVDVDYPEMVYTYDEEGNVTDIDEEIKTYSIPMGWFDVHETSRQASTGIRKISAYNKLKSDFLDKEANALIIEKFGTAPVRIMDILQFLLEDYQVKDPDFTPWWFDKNGKFYPDTTNAKKYFNPVKYATLSSDPPRYKWAFTPAAFYTNPRYRISTNTKIYMQGYATEAVIKFPYGRNGVRIKVNPLATQIDTAIANFIQDEIAKVNFYQLPQDVWNRLRDMRWARSLYSEIAQVSNIADKGYFFKVTIVFTDGTTRTYGNQVIDAAGTFEQLGMTTFSNVESIHLMTPLWIDYGYRFEKYRGDYYIKQEIGNEYYYDEHGDVQEIHRDNHVYLTGDPGADSYKNRPTLPDGSYIPSDIYKCFEVHTLSGDIPPIELIEVIPSELPSVTLRDLQTAVFETECQFGRLDRETNYFSGIELNHNRLYPSASLYPDEDLYPLSTSESGFNAMYSKLWADEGNVHSWKNLVIAYKGLTKNEDTQEVEEVEKTYTTLINANGTEDYEAANNWLFKNIIWADDESEDFPEAAGLEKIDDYATAMVNKMQSVSWFPFEMWCAGLPYVETGDELEIHVGENSYTTYVLRRNLKGIQNLQDEMINGTLDIF